MVHMTVKIRRQKGNAMADYGHTFTEDTLHAIIPRLKIKDDQIEHLADGDFYAVRFTKGQHDKCWMFDKTSERAFENDMRQAVGLPPL